MGLSVGIDVGTSGVKVVLFDAQDVVLAEANEALTVSSPHPNWAEQEPDDWCAATDRAIRTIAAAKPELMARVGGMGLSGMMIGTVFIDKDDKPIGPCALWNDRRALAECAELLAMVPDIGSVAHGTPDPGFPASKLLWFAKHDPETLARADCLLSPKDYVRLWLTGERATEPSDASASNLMDLASATWSPRLLEATGWSADRLPPKVASWESGGGLRQALAAEWGMPAGIPVAGGAADNPACCIGVGVADRGDALVTLGTSAVTCVIDNAYRPAADQAVLTTIHAAPDAFVSMGVIMSATGTVAWLADLLGVPVTTLAEEAEAFAAGGRVDEAPVVVPALSGFRTPHNRPDLSGLFSGLSTRTDRGALFYAVIEGVAFQVRECIDAKVAAGIGAPTALAAVGGGARNAQWLGVIATLLDAPMARSTAAPVAAALGGARLGRVAAGGMGTAGLSQKPAAELVVEPRAADRDLLAERYAQYQTLVGEMLARRVT